MRAMYAALAVFVVTDVVIAAPRWRGSASSSTRGHGHAAWRQVRIAAWYGTRRWPLTTSVVTSANAARASAA